MRPLPAIFANFLLILAAFGVGSLLIRVSMSSFRRIDQLTAALVAGLGSLGTVLFLVGLIRLSRFTVLALFLPFAVLGAWFLYRDRSSILAPVSPKNVPVIPALVIAFVLLITFVGGLAKPVGKITSSDAVAYHYLGPRVWLRDGVIHPVPDECHSSFPAVVETLYAALLSTGGPRAMELFGFSSLALLLFVAYGLALRLDLGRPGAFWAAALVVTMPAVYRGCYGGFVDGILWCFVLLSLRLALDAASLRQFALAGLFSGFAMSTKYHGIITTILILSVALCWHFWRDEKFSRLMNSSISFVFVAAVSALPWYLRNWIVLGSPIYPPPLILARHLQVRYMSLDALARLNTSIERVGMGMGHEPLSFVLLPFRLTFHPANYLNGAGGVGLSLLALAPFGLLVCWRFLLARVVALFIVLWSIAWFVTEQDTRFLIHVFVLLAIFAIWGWHFVKAKGSHFAGVLASVTVAASILYGLVMIVSARAADMHAALSSSYEIRREKSEIPYFASFSWLNDNLEVHKVLVLDSWVPTYYLKKNYIKPVGRFGEISLPQDPNAEQALKDLSKLDITHVLDVVGEHQGFRITGSQPDLVLVFDGGDQRIYQVVAAPSR